MQECRRLANEKAHVRQEFFLRTYDGNVYNTRRGDVLLHQSESQNQCRSTSSIFEIH
jgi:hypothetical protein